MAAKKSAAYRRLKNDIIDDLKTRGLVGEMYTDKVQEYMDLWEQREALSKDIKERGVTVFDEKRGMEVENRSVSLKVQTSRQMLAIFAALGYKADSGMTRRRDSDEDDEL